MDIETYLRNRIEALSAEMQRKVNEVAAPYSSAIGELQAALDIIKKEEK